MLMLLLEISMILALVAAVTSRAAVSPKQGLGPVALWLCAVLGLNLIGAAIYLVTNVAILRSLGFLELSILVCTDLAILAAIYGLLVAGTLRFAPILRDATARLRTSARLLLPTLVLGLLLTHYHVLSYCASGWPADPRCKVVFRFLS
jgi:hypothetical protein